LSETDVLEQTPDFGSCHVWGQIRHRAYFHIAPTSRNSL